MQVSPSVPDLLSRISLSARTILDVGCGSGELAAAYHRMNPKARLLGIEQDPAAAARAAPYLEKVATIDVEADPLPFEVSDGIDCIIYNGILHRLRDPWALIRAHKQALSPDGVMLIAVPNIEYWRMTERRMRGALDEEEAGWQHQPHARWLNMAGLRENLRRTGLAVCDIATLEPDAESAKWFCDALAPGLSALGIDPADFARRAAASHLICRARKDPVQTMIVTGNMLSPIGGVSHVRVVHPLQALASDPAIKSGLTGQLEKERPNDGIPRIFVLHRPSLAGEQGHDTFRRLAEAGYLSVTEFDDHPDHFPMMRMGGELSFTGAHALQTSTAAMAEVLRKYNPEVAVFPNAVVSLPEIRNFTDSRSMTLFFGALNREVDWQKLIPVINGVAAKAGERLKFQVVHDKAFFDALETEHKTFTPTCDYDTYLRILGGSEISFMPLGDTPFNRAKSDLKFIEAGSCRVASLASTVVYGDSIDDGRTGLLFRDESEFHSRLLRLIAMPELARGLADAARDYVADHRMLAYQVAPRIAWYRSLWTRRAVLEQARRMRLQARQAA